MIAIDCNTSYIQNDQNDTQPHRTHWSLLDVVRAITHSENGQMKLGFILPFLF